MVSVFNGGGGGIAGAAHICPTGNGVNGSGGGWRNRHCTMSVISNVTQSPCFLVLFGWGLVGFSAFIFCFVCVCLLFIVLCVCVCFVLFSGLFC